MNRLFCCFVGVAVPAALLACGGPLVNTQPQRLDYIHSMSPVGLQKAMRCDNAKLTFKETVQKGFVSYDHYDAEGCGQRSEYITAVSRQDVGGTWIVEWRASVVPSEKEFQAGAESGLRKTAQFDLDCKTDVEFEFLNLQIDPLRESLSATVGARGCGKKSTYHTVCSHPGFENGKHEISCVNVITSSGS
jgi:hypothetical protein